MKRRTFCASALAAGAFSTVGARFARAAAASSGVPALSNHKKQVVLAEKAVREFASTLRGALLLPGQSGYEQARHIWNGAFDRHPALIARCAGASDVMRAVTFGREHDLLVAVRGGGHSLSGQSVCEGGMVIDLSPMRGVRVDPLARMARAAPGALLSDLDGESLPFSLATPAGTVSHTGIAGLTLGGGYGRIARKFGLTCDNLVAADLITADARFVRASAKENADLFWGLRGGGGNFGVVTSFEYRLHPLNPTVFGGVLIFPFAAAGDVLQFWSDFGQSAPDELDADVVLTRGPGGAPVLVFDVCHCGSQQDAERDLKPLRTLRKPIMDRLGPAPYIALQKSGDEKNRRGRNYYIKSGFVRQIDRSVADTAMELIEASPMPDFSIVFVHQGGAISRVDAAATAVAHRASPYSMVLVSAWDDHAETDRNVEWARAAWRKVEPFTDGFYVNTANADDPTQRVRDTYGRNYERLLALKRKYDPTNFFHLNANIDPAA